MEAGGGVDLRSEINVTPLVDVVLVLLIIFMVIIPLTMRGYDVDIPGESVETTALEPSREQVVLAIDLSACPVIEPPASPGLPEDCRVRINDEHVAVPDLPRRIAEIFSTREPAERVLFLAAEERLNYEAVMRIVDAAESGVPDLRIGLVTKRARAS